jgi:hypothetical protein
VIDQASKDKAELQATLQDFYTKYHPDGLANVESLVAKYWSTWRKRKLVESLHDKYADAIRIQMEASMETGRVHPNPPGEASYAAPAIANNDPYVYVSSENKREDDRVESNQAEDERTEDERVDVERMEDDRTGDERIEDNTVRVATPTPMAGAVEVRVGVVFGPCCNGVWRGEYSCRKRQSRMRSAV